MFSLFRYLENLISRKFPIEVYTDASVSHETGRGAWAAVIRDPLRPNRQEHLIGELPLNISSFFAEAEAIRLTLESLDTSRRIRIFTDNENVVRCVESAQDGLIKRHKARFSNLARKLATHNATLTWVRGHHGNRWNTAADALCKTHRKELEQAA